MKWIKKTHKHNSKYDLLFLSFFSRYVIFIVYHISVMQNSNIIYHAWTIIIVWLKYRWWNVVDRCCTVTGTDESNGDLINKEFYKRWNVKPENCVIIGHYLFLRWIFVCMCVSCEEWGGKFDQVIKLILNVCVCA